MATTDEDVQDAVTIEGQPEAKELVLKFLVKIRSSMENEGTVRVQLLHVGPTTDRLIGAYPYTFGDVQDVANEILEKANDYAEHQPSGKVKYQLQARVGAAASTATFSLKVQQDGDEDYELEPATDEGREAQRMKYTLQLQKQSLDTTKVAIRASQMPVEMLYRMIENLEAKNQRLEQKLERADLIREKLLDGQQARDIAYEEFRRKQARQDQALKMLGPAAKMLVAHLVAGQGASPEAVQQMMNAGGAPTQAPGSRDQAASGESRPSHEDLFRVFVKLERLFSGPNALTREQVMEILPIMTPDQQTNLGELHMDVLEMRERAAPRAPEPEPATKTNGTNGSHGGAAYVPFGGS